MTWAESLDFLFQLFVCVPLGIAVAAGACRAVYVALYDSHFAEKWLFPVYKVAGAVLALAFLAAWFMFFFTLGA